MLVCGGCIGVGVEKLDVFCLLMFLGGGGGGGWFCDGIGGVVVLGMGGGGWFECLFVVLVGGVLNCGERGGDWVWILGDWGSGGGGDLMFFDIVLLVGLFWVVLDSLLLDIDFLFGDLVVGVVGWIR